MIERDRENAWERSTTELNDLLASDAPRLENLQSLLGLLAGDASGRTLEPRRAYRALQRVAPCNGLGVPLDAQFELVRCYDLSASGISFYWRTLPTFDHAVIALASTNGTIHILARVVSSTPQTESPGRHLIRCQFVRRLQE